MTANLPPPSAFHHDSPLLNELVQRYPNKHWDWAALSMNIGITEETVLKTIRKPWRWEYLAANIGITIEFVYKYYVVKHLLLATRNPMLRHINSFVIYRQATQLEHSRHPTISFRYPAMDWNHYTIDKIVFYSVPFRSLYYHKCSCQCGVKYCTNPRFMCDDHLTVDDFVRYYPDGVADGHLLRYWQPLPTDFIERVSRSPQVTFDDILAHPELPWNWRCVACNPNVTIDHILAHPELRWTGRIARNPNITFQDVIEHPKLPWSFKVLSRTVEHTRPPTRYELAVRHAVRMAIEFLPAGRHPALPRGGIRYQQQLADLGLLIGNVN